MFIEERVGGKFLFKKIYKKKISVKISDNIITKKAIEELSHKEYEYVIASEKYRDFSKKIYNQEILQSVVFKAIFLQNTIEVIKIKDIKHTDIGAQLLTQGKYSMRWVEIIFPIKFIHHSNHIEGSKISQEEVQKIIQNKKYVYKVKNEIEEVKNSIKTWDFLNTKFIFNEANIKKIYHILTKKLVQKNGLKYPRGFKKIENIVNNNLTTTPENVSREIHQLIQNYKFHKKDIFSFQQAFDFHLKYEQIHPFEDGNGRTGRFLMNKILMQNRMFPMIVFKDNKQGYSNAISSCSSGNKKKYYTFMVEQYSKTLEQYYKTFEQTYRFNEKRI